MTPELRRIAIEVGPWAYALARMRADHNDGRGTAYCTYQAHLARFGNYYSTGLMIRNEEDAKGWRRT